jgi:PAS domain S-box-containing protein
VPPSRPTDAPDFWRATLDSLPAQVAVLDGAGVILAVNEEWRRTAVEAGQHETFDARSYLDVCDAAGSAGDVSAATAATGLRSVLSGSAPSFEMTYPCHTPTRERWFRMQATRYAGAGGGAVVVAHHDVSAQQSAENQVADQAALLDELAVAGTRDESSRAEAAAYLHAVTDSMGEGLFAVDADGVVTLMNRAAETMLGWPLADIQGLPLHELTHYRRGDGTPYPVEECPILAPGEGATTVRVTDDVFVTRDGRDLPVSYTSSPLRGADGREGHVVVFLDATHIRDERERLRLSVEQLSAVHRVEEALREDRFLLYAQPIVDLATGAVTQHELLLRVQEPGGTVAGPAPYLVAAELHDLIGTIDRWVIGESVSMAAQGHAVELNVSASSVSDPDVLVEVEQWLTRTGADPALLVFEITETTLIRDEEAGRSFVERLHELGCKVALDDFGTGYGGFTYLKQLPLDYLKIDIEFVRDLWDNQASRHVVEAVVNLAAGFGLQTVAEGVEDARTLELLARLGVGFAQGYHLGRPGPLADTLFQHTQARKELIGHD